MKAFYIIALWVLIVACNSDSKIKERQFYISNALFKEFQLSEITDQIIYIPLDSEILFGGALRVELTNNNIIIGPNGESILNYNWKGKFLNKIGTRGRGPGEYQFSWLFTIDSENDIAYIYDNHKIIVYKLNGEFLKELSTNQFGEMFHDVYYNEGKIYLGRNLNLGQAKYNWLIIDTLGNQISYKLNSIPEFKTGFRGKGGFIKAPNKLYYWNEFNDTIFLLSEKGYQPFIFFGQDEYRKPHDDISLENLRNYINLDRIFAIKDYFFIKYIMGDYTYISLIDKKEGSVNIINKNKETFIGYLPGIINDIDCGPDFNPLFYSSVYGKEFLITWLNAYQLIAHIESEAFKNSTPKYPEKKKELEELAASLDENDNPVLMLVRLKD